MMWSARWSDWLAARLLYGKRYRSSSVVVTCTCILAISRPTDRQTAQISAFLARSVHFYHSPAAAGHPPPPPFAEISVPFPALNISRSYSAFARIKSQFRSYRNVFIFVEIYIYSRHGSARVVFWTTRKLSFEVDPTTLAINTSVLFSFRKL